MLKTLNIDIGNQKKVQQQHHIKKNPQNIIGWPLHFPDASQGDGSVQREQKPIFGRLPDKICLDHGAKYTITNK